MKKLTTDEFIERAKRVHGNKYDYSKVEYINNHTKVCIICPIHGEFWQNPNSHLIGFGCKKCTKNIVLSNTEDFILKAKEVHYDKYDYSKAEYVNANTKVCIICPIHGEFWQNPYNHLNGTKCPKCGNEERSKKMRHKTTEDFIKEAIKIHGNKFDYSKVEYISSHKKVCIICPIHGEFWQQPKRHLKGEGCKKCYGNQRKTTEEFIEQAKKVHGDKYDYSKVEYINERTPIEIICHKKYKNGMEHGSFFQKPYPHLKGNGCPHCRNSSLENRILKLLKEKNIFFEKEKTYEWLINDGHMYLDFYLPKYNVAIECQGVQHYIDIEIRGRKNYKYIHKNDLLKNELCKKNGIKIFYFTEKVIYENYCKNKELTYYDFNSMIKDIKNECTP
jgi:predicted nucleic-acid-binding Zn-ribbon protein